MVIQALLQALFTLVFLFLFGFLLWRIIHKKIKGKKTAKLPLKDAKRLIIDWEGVVESREQLKGVNDKRLLLSDIKKGLKALLKQEQIEEIILDIESMELSSLQIAELAPYFAKLSEKKKIIAYAVELDNASYEMALLADSIYLMDSKNASLSLTGYYQASTYFKKFLEKLGISVEVLHVGDYKSAGENFYLNEMSQTEREAKTALYDSFLESFCKLVENRRKLDIREKLLAGDFSLLDADSAQSYGLIDGTSNEANLKLDDATESLCWEYYFQQIKPDKNKSKNSIALLYLKGNIEEKEGNHIHLDAVEEKLELLEDEDNVKGLLLHIDSPGGSAVESERIYRKLKALDLPIYVSMGDVCASGGYYIASVGKKIFAGETTITGSIGVVMLYPQLSGVLEKLDLHKSVLQKGEGQDMMNLLEIPSETSRTKMLTQMQGIYQEFKDRVKLARNMNEETLEKLAGGRVWSGLQAKEYGLIDGIATLDEVAKQMAEDLELKDYKLLTLHSKRKLPKLEEFMPFGLQSKILHRLSFLERNQGKALLYEDAFDK